MQYRCNDCGELFESHHTNYKYAKGFHPSDNPKQSAEVAATLDHCLSCQETKTYDLYKNMKKQIPNTGYVFPNGFSDLSNWKDADDGSDTSENKITKFMVAIAEQEGFGIPGAIPTRANNPGDLTKPLGYDTTGET